MMKRAKYHSGLNWQRNWTDEAGLNAANRIAATHRMMINLRAKGSTTLWYTTGKLGGVLTPQRTRQRDSVNPSQVRIGRGV